MDSHFAKISTISHFAMQNTHSHDCCYASRHADDFHADGERLRHLCPCISCNFYPDTALAEDFGWQLARWLH
jgi:hypothetical protein